VGQRVRHSRAPPRFAPITHRRTRRPTAVGRSRPDFRGWPYALAVLLTVERVALLRHVELFSGTADRVLAGVASVLDEMQFAPGDVLMREGGVEDWMFVLVEGEVEVARSDRRVTLGPGSVVGELAVLDPQPRSATVTALSPVQAFRLRREAFQEAVESQPEIAMGVITELVRRLRESHERSPT
jgi:CRP/FNR family transcriptional regulator, cyclic AMP receptor protein